MMDGLLCPEQTRIDSLMTSHPFICLPGFFELWPSKALGLNVLVNWVIGECLVLPLCT